MATDKDRDDEILRYIRANAKATKTDVIKHMTSRSMGSTVTTHKHIINLIKEKKILVLKDKPNSQTHHLIINNKNNYILINEQLLEIEAYVDVISESMDNIRKLRDNDLKSELSSFVSNYNIRMDLILRRLQIKIYETIHSENESQSFYARIAKLIVRLNSQQPVHKTDQSPELLAKTFAMQQHVNRISPETAVCAKKHGINTDLNDRAMKIFERFTNRFQN